MATRVTTTETVPLTDWRLRWLRISYWAGAITDAVAAVGLLVPGVAAAVYRLPGFDPGADYRYASGVAASLMLGWTALLLWADRRPLERRGVLVLTVIPVIAGLVLAGVLAVADGFATLPAMAPTWALQCGLSVLFLFSYHRARSSG
jgi:hypothetical protein